jgi:hypothetical protein
MRVIGGWSYRKLLVLVLKRNTYLLDIHEMYDQCHHKIHKMRIYLTFLKITLVKKIKNDNYFVGENSLEYCC